MKKLLIKEYADLFRNMKKESRLSNVKLERRSAKLVSYTIRYSAPTERSDHVFLLRFDTTNRRVFMRVSYGGRGSINLNLSQVTTPYAMSCGIRAPGF